jgi:hypothetical protein
MAEALPVIVPTLTRAARGTFRPARDPDTAVVLFDRTQRQPRAIQSLFQELALYVQASGVAVLHFEAERDADVTTHACDVLAAVSFVQSLGVRHAILVSAVDEGLPLAAQDIACETLAGLADLMRRRYASAVELAEATTSLIATVRAVAEAVVGVATLSALPGAPFGTARRLDAQTLGIVPLRTPRDTGDGAETIGAAQARTAAELHLRLPSGDSSPAVVALISQLYSWVLRLQPAGAGGLDLMDTTDVLAPQAIPAAEAAEQPARSAAVWSARLESDWQAITDTLAGRAPERAARARSAERRRDALDESIVRGAGYAWQYLDSQARHEWLDCCARVFGESALRAHETARRIVTSRPTG